MVLFRIDAAPSEQSGELVAEELKLDLSTVDLSSVVSRREGETEKNINRVFDDAERSGSILFFDGGGCLIWYAPRKCENQYVDAGAAHLLQRIETIRARYSDDQWEEPH